MQLVAGRRKHFIFVCVRQDIFRVTFILITHAYKPFAHMFIKSYDSNLLQLQCSLFGAPGISL